MEIRQVEVNGVVVEMTTVADLKALEVQGTPLVGDLVVIGRITLRDLIQIAGHNATKIDYAVPGDWARRNGKDPSDYVWSYEKPGSIFGEPLSVRQLRTEATANIRAALAEAGDG